MKRFIDIHVPITSCNFKCHYCYVTQTCKNNTEKVEFKYSVEVVRQALSKDRMGGVCLFNVCGLGETLIPEELLPYIKALLQEGHFVMIVTNGTLTKRFEEIAKFEPVLLSRLFFKFSFHFLELKRLNLMNVFISNVKLMRAVGCSFTIEVTPNDELEPHIDEIKRICLEEFGAWPHVTIPRKENDKTIPLLSKHTFEEFCNIWGVFDSELFEFKKSIWGVKRKEFCHAGEWSGLLNLGTGIWQPCYVRLQKRNIFENVNEPFEFYPVGCHCQLPHCYNGHSFLTLGDIPSINTFHYADVRDRQCSDGSHWLNSITLDFYNERLEDKNEIISDKNILRRQRNLKRQTILKNVKMHIDNIFIKK